ncbi:hypothetical protein [Acinetobacter sp. YH12070]|uniref:hypothetical protein n=1 Tax=Acinetobacter sp. YH12070 TaxID=2601066 RepID=UPI0015D41CA9|nr:hypothetical protein [Acinetobacter sp. YH12070]
MKFSYALCLGLSLSVTAQTAFCAATNTASNNKLTMPAERTSLIEKAINQQKSEGKGRTDDNLKVLTSIKAAPTQSFFASQNQSFSRFVQAIFSGSNS